MPRKKRDTKPFNINMDRETYNRLEEYAEAKGQTKTLAVERILQSYFDKEDKKEKGKDERSNGELK